MTPTNQLPTRTDQLADLVNAHWTDSPDAPVSDPLELTDYFTGELPCGQFALVCSAPLAPAQRSISPDYPTLLSAMRQASDLLRSHLREETPLEIVNLDTGERWIPEYPKLGWVVTPRLPLAAQQHAAMQLDKTGTEYAPLEGAESKRPGALYALTSELHTNNIAAATVHGQVHTSEDFAAVWNKLSNRYTAGIPISGARMKKLVARCVTALNSQ
ncbi:MAG: hypothetical protein JHD02_00165 [Thermoleophilaceae bacterium]|nr:hypothetical protein [Thermoleophilaceae bacterium]